MGKGGEVPKFVEALIIIFTLLYTLILYLMAFSAIPFHLYVLFVNHVFGSKSLWENKFLYIILWFFRWLFSSIAFPIWAGVGVIIGYFSYTAANNLGISIGVPIAYGVSTIIGMIYIRIIQKKKIKSFKIVWKADSKDDSLGYFDILVESWFDFTAFFAFIISCISIIRIPCLLIASVQKKPKDWRNELCKQALFAIIDILLLPIYIFDFICFWRIHYLLHGWKKELGMKDNTAYRFTVSFEIRGVAIMTTLNILLDIPVFLGGLILLITPWQFPKIIKRINNSNDKSMSFVRWELLNHIGLALLDIGAIIISLPVIATLYRLPLLIYLLFKANKYYKRRVGALFLFGMIIPDIVTLGAGLLIILTVYRIPKLWKACKENWGSFSKTGSIKWPEAQMEIFYQGLKVIRDFPFLIMGIIVTCSIWRAPFMWIDVKKETKTLKKGKTIAMHFGLLFIDILDLPFVISSLIIVITLWRVVPLVKELKKAWSDGRNAMRLQALLQIGLWLWDIPTAIAFVIIMLTFYRAKDTIEQLSELKKKYYSDSNSDSNTNAQPPPPDPSIDDEENPIPEHKTVNWSWHTIVWKQFGLLLMDLPIAILTVFTLWRLPFLVKKLITECETAMERRVTVLTTLFKTGKDILVAIFFIILCVSWRIVSIVKLFREYKQGDDEHRLILNLFLEYIKDLPFFGLFLINLPFLWRSIPLTLYLIFLPGYDKETDGEEDNTRRIAIAATSIIIFLDFVFAILTIFVFCCVWRIPSAIELLIKNLKKKEKDSKNPYEKTFSYYKSIGLTFIIILIDFVSVIQIILIFVGIIHFPSFIKRCYNVVYNWKNREKALQDINFDDFTRDDIIDAEEQTLNEGIEWMSFTLFRIITINEFLGTLRDIPHLLLLPIKAIGLLFLPIYIFINWQIKRKGSLTMSFLWEPLLFIQDISETRISFWGLHQFAILILMGSVIIVPNYLALIPMSINSILIFICTFGDPLWSSLRETFGYIGLGTGEGCCGILDNILLVSNLIWIPILIFVQFIFILLPIWIFVILTLPFTDAADYFYVFFEDPSVYWKAVAQMPGWVWVIFVIWLVTMAAAEHLTVIHVIKYYSLFNPVTAIMWLIKKVLAGKLWGFYRALLGIPTQWAYVNRKTCCCIGEIAIAPIIIIWTCWPVIIPCVVQLYWNPDGWYLWLIAAPMVTFFFWNGVIKKPMAVVRLNWRVHQKIEVSPFPKVNIEAITASFPTAGGFAIRIKGKKPPSLKIEQALLFLEGQRADGAADQFWSALGRIFGSKSISMGKMTMYPVKLVPNHIYNNLFSSMDTTVDFTIHIPDVMSLFGKSITIKKTMLEPNFKKIVEEGDPEVEFRVEYTSRSIKEGPYKKHGIIVAFKTKFSDILSADAVGQLHCTVMDDAGNWAPPPSTFDAILKEKQPLIPKNNNKQPKKVSIPKDEDELPPPKVKKVVRVPFSVDAEEMIEKGSTSNSSESESESELKKKKSKSKPKSKEKIEPIVEPSQLIEEIKDINEGDVNELIGMGFDPKLASEALKAYPGNKEGAVNYLLNLANDSSSSS